MKKLSKPIPANSKGKQVADLHDIMLALGFKVSKKEVTEQHFGESTKKVVELFQKQYTGELEITGEVDASTLKKINEVLAKLTEKDDDGNKEKGKNDGNNRGTGNDKGTGGNTPKPEGYSVKGHCYDANEKPLAKVTVKAYDRDLRSEELLGATRTDAKGYYEIRYTPVKFNKAELGTADIIVKIENADGRVLAQSPIHFNCGQDVTIDMKIGGGTIYGASEYEQLVSEITPLLQKLVLTDLKEDKDYQDITFISNETGKDKSQIAMLVLANLIAAQTKIQPEVFYCLFRQKIPMQIDSYVITYLNNMDQAVPLDQILLKIENDTVSVSTDNIRLNLRAGIGKNIISFTFLGQLDSIISEFNNLQVQHTLQQPYLSGKTPLKDLLNVSSATKNQQQAFATLFIRNTGNMKTFWKNLPAQPGFTTQAVDDLKLTLQLGSYTSNHLPLVTYIKQQKQQGKINSPAELAKLDVNDWVNILNTNVNGKPIGYPDNIDGKNSREKTLTYATILATRFETRFPTTAFLGRLLKDTSSPAILTAKSDLVNFFSTYPQFRLGVTNVDKFFADTVTSQPSDAMKSQLKMVHRLFKVTSTYAAAKVLLNDNIHSAQQIYSMGRANFLAKYGGTDLLGKITSNRIYAKAEFTYASTLALYAGYNSAFNRQILAALPNLQPDPQTLAQIKQIPDLETLFGSQDFCDCMECRSVGSAAAYLVDMLQFLKQRMQTNGKSPKDVLFERRPDLGLIGLNCENTNTPLPYIDLVCELLEDVVAPPMTPVSKQTTNTAEELAANPEYINTAAYDFAGTQVFPFNLPFDLWIENARTYLTNMGMSWYQLRNTFNGVKAFTTLQNYQINDEYLLISDVERQIITGQYPSKQSWDFWGLNQNTNSLPDPLDPTKTISGDWITVLSYVPMFLHRTGLVYKQLLVLLELKYINPGGAIQIVDAEQSGLSHCDTSQFSIQTFQQADLDRINMFIRLWQKLNCDMWELDKLIMNKQVGNGVINDDTLLRISLVQQIKDQYSLSYEAIMAFWGDIDSQNYTDYTSDDEPVIYSLYEQLFRNKTVLEIKDIEAFFPEDPSALTGNLSDALIPISSACTISLSDMNLIFAYLSVDLTTAQLNLDNLSKIFRYSQLATTFGVTTGQLITLQQLLSPLDAFSGPDQTLSFGTKVQKILASNFSIDQLNYLLRNDWIESSGVAPDPLNIATFLTDIRTGLNKIYDETVVSSHPDPDELAKKLAMLKWNNSLIVEVGNLFNDKVVYSANISTLPVTPIVFPSGISISYDPVLQILSFTGVMTDSEKTQILAVPAIAGDPTAPAIVQQFYDAPRNFVISQMKYFVTPIYSAPLSQLPPDVQFPSLPAALNAKISYDSNRKLLNFAGAMSTDEQTALLAADASNDADYKTAINTLFNAPSTVTPDPENLFMVTNVNPLMDDIKIVFDPAQTPTIEDRFRYVIQKLCTYLRKTMCENFVEQEFATNLQISTAISEQLIINFQASQTVSTYRIIQDFNQDNFVLSNNTISADSFPNQFTSYIQLFKIAYIVTGLKISDDEWQWWMTNSTLLGALAFNQIPLASGTSVPFSQFEVLMDAYTFASSLPKSSLTFARFLQYLIDPTLTQDALRLDIATYTYWDTGNLKQLESFLSLVNPSDYRNFTILLNLSACFKALTQLGITADKAVAWVAPAFSADLADKVKQAAKAKYDNSQWLKVAKGLQDGIRQKKRDALVAYLLYHPELKGQTWQTTDDLYSYFLIDTEMGACMLTSRIVQANSAIQLFVQRCLMNLEAEVVADTKADPDWNQWQWMKYYRLWQANRLVFLYPENWIEPGLRDDKSPFFKDLESKLLQGEITSSLAEDAFMDYLESLDAVARLEVCGTYLQQEYETNLLHVIGRTHSDPPIYYYRNKDLNTNVWTAWSKVDVDIVSNQIVPVLWNRRLYIFWPIFTEKPDKKQPLPPAQPSSTPPPPPVKYWEVQLAWSEHKQSKWLAKKISKEKLIISDSGTYPKDNFTLKTFILPNGDLEIAFFSSIFHVTYIDEEINMGIFTIDMKIPLITVTGPSKFAKFSLTGVKDFLQVYSIEKNAPGVDFSSITDDAKNILPLTDPVVNLNLPANEMIQDMDFVNTGAGHFSQDNSRFNTFYTNFVAKNKSLLANETTLTQADPFAIVVPHQLLQFDSSIPFFYQDTQKSYYITAVKYYQNGYSWITTPPSNPYNAVIKTDYLFKIFYHPFVDLFIKELNRWGVGGILNRTIQVSPGSIYNTPAFDFSNYYKPTSYVDKPYPIEDVDFTNDGAYSIYNWELFFHAPLLIATQLSQNQRFEEAMQWFHYIFNPTNTSGDPAPARYWITRPFFETTQADYLKQRIDQVMAAIAKNDPEADDEVKQWRNNPFNPFLIARLRPVAFQKTVVMKYIDNLIAWGDNQFSMNTMESINIATQLYILAAEILGPRPQDIPALKTPDNKTYDDIEASLDAFSNVIIDIETLTPPGNVNYSSTGNTPKLPVLQTLYFCIPPNDILNSYWDTVADRLFKIRNCMNIQGVVQQLPLFQPPINPALLVKAAAAGVDISSVLSDLDAQLPFYRFNIISQKAISLCSELQALGGALLQALEKRDAEALALLRSSLEIKLLDKVRDVKQRQVDEANQNLGAVQASKVVINDRFNYYNTIVKINANEQSNIDNLNQAHTYQEISQGIMLGAAILAIVPDLDLGISGFGGSPNATVKLGGLNFSAAVKATSDVFGFLAMMKSNDAMMAQIQGGFDRRWDEWQLQKQLAQDELNQCEYQIAAAEIRLDIAGKELENHDIQRDHDQQVYDFMNNKYTNRELYDWMVGQISNIYFQGYQLAYDMAKKAERSFRHELGLQDSNYVQFGYWDSLKKGLLAGDLLYHDLQRMEAAYLDLNLREFELTKQISLAMTDPVSLLKLKENGICYLDLTEMLFDMDYPGHYMRRIKSISISIPCIVGPYTTVACTLTLIKNSLRINSTLLNGKYPRDITKNDPRFIDNLGSIQSIATSSAQNDSGLFELNFRDERYLPFEGTGAISSWQIQLNSQFPQFDFNTISDVIIHFKYTSRDGGQELGAAASANLLSQINTIASSDNKTGLFRVFSAKQEFPNNWYRFLNPVNPGDDQELLFELSNDRFPFYARDWAIKCDRIELVALVTQPNNSDYKAIVVPPLQTTDVITLTQDHIFGNLHHGVKTMSATGIGNWILKMQKSGASDYKSLDPDEIQDILLVVHYKKS